jgi:hypothetical protein
MTSPIAVALPPERRYCSSTGTGVYDALAGGPVQGALVGIDGRLGKADKHALSCSGKVASHQLCGLCCITSTEGVQNLAMPGR